MTAGAPPTTTTAPAPVLTGPEAQRAAELVELTGIRLADPQTVADVAGADGNREPVFNTLMWEPMALSHGYPGTALMFGELARRDPKWLAPADAHLRVALREMPRNPTNGLYYGPAAVLAAAETVAGAEGHYATLRAKLTHWVAADQQKRLASLRERTERGEQGVPWFAYDVINGLSGTGRLLLDAAAPEAGGTGVVSDTADTALRATLEHLVRMTEPLDVRGERVPGWWIPQELQPVEQDKIQYPEGDFNLGLAHGAPGPLTLLCLAAERGVEVPGLRDAVRALAQWLADWTMHDAAGPYWPCRVSWQEETGAQRPDAGFTRTAWCYGAPGVAGALHRAGRLLGEQTWQDLAVSSMRVALERDESEWRVDGPTVCHGYAGLLQVLVRMARDTGDETLAAGARRMALRVLDFADEDAPFVFRHLVPDHPEGWRRATAHRRLDVAGVLEGAAGVACALLEVLPDGDARGTGGGLWRGAAWDRVLMLG
ncbi:lanthionine synthetase C family protein [Streptomyces sp. NPDC048442]|uniref:lanthionine synthetase C family protein n=1 Tax=Streptomyces sp. NPDC048442 TaxID=3154823 RepID=UPI00343A31A1